MTTGNENFADMLKEHEARQGKIEPGQKINGRIIVIGDDFVFVDVGQKQDGIIEKKDLLDNDGNLKVNVGDEVEAYITGFGSQGILLSRSLSGAGIAMLEEAKENELPVEGRVKAACKGGYQIEIGAHQAFCPGSQMEQGPDEEIIGQKMRFLITRIENRGRNIVVSRRALLQRERQEAFEKLKENVNPGDIVEVKITRVAPFGAFAELAPGIEGMIHLSELAWSRVEACEEIVNVNDEVKVKVLEISQNDKGQARISLSRKQALEDPWLMAARTFKQGDVVEGKVARLAPFGAFVELAPGVDGLAHISEMAWGKRINHPEEAVKQGELVKVLIKEILPQERKISLSLKDALGDPWENMDDSIKKGAKIVGKVESRSQWGLFVNLVPGITGLLPKGVMKNAKNSKELEKLNTGDSIPVIVQSVDLTQKRISLLPETQETAGEENDSSWRQHAKLENQQPEEEAGVMAQALRKAFLKKGV